MSFLFTSSLAYAQPVWLDLDQEALDSAYDQAAYAPNLEQVLERFDSNSELLRQRLGPPQRFAYGEGPNESLDLFATEKKNAPIHVFIHGGAWKLALRPKPTISPKPSPRQASTS
ncbi:hypothetical protein QEH53_10615 [Pelagicoccus sp. SDUM812002]|nr:hypothetical protein [Pelagicoccus sp. SDUM812002]